MSSISEVYDVLVAGGGNAGLCAAISAAENGAKVLLLEPAPKQMRGGNSRHTRDIRCMHNRPTSVLSGSYSKDEFFEDLLKVTGGITDKELADIVIERSSMIYEWMISHGVHLQLPYKSALSLGRTNIFFIGGGKALVNSYYKQAEKLGVDVLYNSRLVDMRISNAKFELAKIIKRGFPFDIKAKSIVLASGGFEANLEWLKKAWGPAGENFLIRGTPYNKGEVLKILMCKGAKITGDPTECHAVAIDARSPKYDGGIITRLDCVPFGIVINRNAERFYDEGEDFWPKRYALWGRLIAAQPEQIAYSIIDSKSLELFMPSVFNPIRAATIDQLAEKIGVDGSKLNKTIASFNNAVEKDCSFDCNSLDNCKTKGISPPKTHWARRINTPPYFAYPLRPGITFTYLAAKINRKAQVIIKNGSPLQNVFAAGEIMAGNILGRGYLAGFGLTIGTVFGIIAGRYASKWKYDE